MRKVTRKPLPPRNIEVTCDPITEDLHKPVILRFTFDKMDFECDATVAGAYQEILMASSRKTMGDENVGDVALLAGDVDNTVFIWVSSMATVAAEVGFEYGAREELSTLGEEIGNAILAAAIIRKSLER